MDKTSYIYQQIFVSKFPSEGFEQYLLQTQDVVEEIVFCLSQTLADKNNRAVNLLLDSALLNNKKLDARYVDVFLEILNNREDWNHAHEVICEYLAIIKAPQSIESLYRAAIDFPASELHSIPLKAVWALKSINTPEAENALKKLTVEADAKTAKKVMNYMNPGMKSLPGLQKKD